MGNLDHHPSLGTMRCPSSSLLGDVRAGHGDSQDFYCSSAETRARRLPETKKDVTQRWKDQSTKEAQQLKCVCTKQWSCNTCEAKTDRTEGENRQTHACSLRLQYLSLNKSQTERAVEYFNNAIKHFQNSPANESKIHNLFKGSWNRYRDGLYTNKFEKTEIIFSNHSGIKLEINDR